jgi:hypothetical protein
MRRILSCFFFLASLSAAQQPLFRTLDLDAGATEQVTLCDGKSATVKLLSTSETRDRVRSAIRDARVASIQAAYWPTMGIAPGASVPFKVRAFGTTDGEEAWDFGDGATARTKSDGNVAPLAKDGFAVTTHAFQKPGAYIVRVERANRLGHKAITHLIVRVGE